jgi:type IV pilus assembly protein PilC
MSQQFFYKGMDNDGKIVQGELNANNLDDLEQRLERIGLDLIHYRTKKSPNYRVKMVSRRELITFCFHMENLIRAGVPLIDGLGDLRDTLPQSRFREIISSIVENIEGGARLSDSMKDFPDTFDQVFVTLIHAGEESGNLSIVFKHLTDTLKWHDEMIAKSKKLLIYPAFMGTVIVGAIFFIMMYLVPQLISFIKSVGGELPLHTRVLIAVSNIFIHYWFLILIVPVLVFLFVKIAIQISPSFHILMDRLKLRIWVIGPILEKLILARFATFFALLYGAGITILDCLEICKKLVNNLAIERALQRVSDNIVDGMGITESFERAHIFPPLILRMISVGDSTGELDTALSNVSYFYERDVKESIDKLQAMIEPIMTIILGALLGWVIFSVLGPIYDIVVDISGGVEQHGKKNPR